MLMPTKSHVKNNHRTSFIICQKEKQHTFLTPVIFIQQSVTLNEKDRPLITSNTQQHTGINNTG